MSSVAGRSPAAIASCTWRSAAAINRLRPAPASPLTSAIAGPPARASASAASSRERPRKGAAPGAADAGSGAATPSPSPIRSSSASTAVAEAGRASGRGASRRSISRARSGDSQGARGPSGATSPRRAARTSAAPSPWCGGCPHASSYSVAPSAYRIHAGLVRPDEGLGRHVGRRAARGQTGPTRARQAEVGEHDVARRRDQEVGGFDVVVREPGRVELRQRGRQLAGGAVEQRVALGRG